MSKSSTDLRAVLHIALAEARRARTRAGGDRGGHAHKFDSLQAQLEKALVDVERGRAPELHLISKWGADWIPNGEDPILEALVNVEIAAAH